jgi:tetratricopeptide (TPR) repeat protein
VEFAKKAVEREPRAGESWKRLGVALYRAGDLSDSIVALNRSLELNCAEQAASMFFLATAHWKLGEKEQARKCYDQALHWMEKNKREGEELGRFRADAAELLDVAEGPEQTDAPVASDAKEKPSTETSEQKPNGEIKQDENET